MSDSSPSAGVNPASGKATALDVTGDGGAADLVGADLEYDGTTLTVVYRLGSPLPAAGTALLALLVSSSDGAKSRQLGVKYIEDQPSVFVFDFAAASQQNLDIAPQKVGTSLSVTFPAAAITGLGSSFKWRAVSNINGADVDSCPDAGADVLNPATAVFPSG